MRPVFCTLWITRNEIEFQVEVRALRYQGTNDTDDPSHIEQHKAWALHDVRDESGAVIFPKGAVIELTGEEIDRANDRL